MKYNRRTAPERKVCRPPWWVFATQAVVLHHRVRTILETREGNIWRIVEETTSKHVKRVLGEILTGLRNVEKPSDRPAQTKQVSALENRLAAMEKFMNHSLPSNEDMLKNIRPRLDCIESDTRRSIRKNLVEKPNTIKQRTVRSKEDYTDSEEEKEGLSTHRIRIRIIV